MGFSKTKPMLDLVKETGMSEEEITSSISQDFLGSDSTFNVLKTALLVNSKNGPKKYLPFGNSITEHSLGFSTWAGMYSDGRFTSMGNAGVGGNTTQLMLDRMSDIDGAQISPQMEATNDANTLVTAEQHAINVIGLFIESVKRGVLPFWTLSPPSSWVSHTALVSEMNIADWLTCRALGIECFDVWSKYSDGYGIWKSGTSDGGFHPTEQVEHDAGLDLIGKVEGGSSCFPLNINNDFGLFENSLFMVDTGGQGKPDFWATRTWQSSIYFSIDPSDYGESVGNKYTVSTIGNPASGEIYSLSDSTVFELGKTYIFACRVKMDVVSGEPDIYLRLVSDDRSAGGKDTYVIRAGRVGCNDSLVSIEFTAEDIGYSLRMNLDSTDALDYEASISIAQVTLFCVEDNTYVTGSYESMGTTYTLG